MTTAPERCTHSFPDPYPQPIDQPGDCRTCGITYQAAKDAAMNSPARELRGAASRLRKLAAEATPGPWTADSSIPYGHRVGSGGDADWVARTGEHGEDGSEADARYIAAMGPTVGTLLADWLDEEAGRRDASLVAAVQIWGSAEHPDAAAWLTTGLGKGSAHALAVARAINGGEQR